MGVIPEIITITTPDSSDEVIEIIRKKKVREPFPGFSILGNGKTTRFGGESMDILAVCQQLNNGEMELMKFFRDSMEDNKAIGELNPNKVVPTKYEEFTEYLKVALKKNYPHMECLKIVKRIKRGEYMLNPELFIPPKSVVEIRQIWDKLPSKGCNK